MSKEPENDENYQKIFQFLKSDHFDTFLLGIQLLKATMDEDLFIRFLSNTSYLGYRFEYFLLPFLQEHTAFWLRIQAEIPSFRKERINQTMHYKVLELKDNSVGGFCALATEAVLEYLPDFPILSPDILTDSQDYYYVYTQRGSSLVDGIGWSLFIESRDEGPAEVIHIEEWIATAHHPDFDIKIMHNESNGMFPKTWLEKVNTVA